MKVIHFLISIYLTLSISGCASISKARVTESSDNQFITELLQPIYQGQQKLINNIGATAHDVVVFSIKNQNVRLDTKKSHSSDIWAADKVVFFHIKEKINSTPSIYYFDNRNSHFYRVNKTNREGEFLLFKFLTKKGSIFSRKQTQNLVGLKFKYNQQGQIGYSGRVMVANIPGTPYLPVYLREKGIVFFLSRNEKDQLNLYSVDKNGQNLKQHLSKGAGKIARIFTNNGKNLIFESNLKGYQSLFKYDLFTKTFIDFERPLNESTKNNKYALSNRYIHGGTSTAVFELPEKLNLSNITSLVVAQGPEVNLKKAEYAASLIKMGVAELPNNPYVNFEIGTSTVAGLFNNNRGVLSRTIANGLVGLVQPILDKKRNNELVKAAKLDAEISKELIENEINEKVAEALKLYFELIYLKEMDSIWTNLITEYKKRVSYYKILKKQGNSITREILAANNVLVGAKSEHAHNSQQIQFFERNLKQLTGLPNHVRVALQNKNFDFRNIENEKVLHDLAVLNHPRLKIVLNEIQRAHYLESAGPNVRQKLNFTADYVFTGNDSSNSIIDNVNIGLDGSISTAQKKSNRLHSEYWKQMKDALRIKLGIRSNQIHLQLNEALKDLKAAENDLLAKKASVAYFLEKIRVARLYESIDHLNEQDLGDPLRVSTAVAEYLKSISKLAKVKKDIGVRYINVWRETGRSKLLSEKLKISEEEKIVATKGSSIWLWHTKKAIATDEARTEFIELAKHNRVNRVYAYLYSDSRLLTNEVDREKLSLFINACKRSGINVWGLLGEPEWLTANNAVASLSQSIDRVLEYNRSRNSFEPSISGIKLDIEPHAFKGWDTDIKVRTPLNNRYIELLKTTKYKLRGKLPLWIDAPVKLFTHKINNDLMNKILQLTDGITAMAYFNNPKTISSVAKKILRKSSKPIEIGVEFSSKAPKTDSLYPVQRKDMFEVLKSISNQLKSSPNYTGISLHDYTALKTMTGQF